MDDWSLHLGRGGAEHQPAANVEVPQRAWRPQLAATAHSLGCTSSDSSDPTPVRTEGHWQAPPKTRLRRQNAAKSGRLQYPRSGLFYSPAVGHPGVSATCHLPIQTSNIFPKSLFSSLCLFPSTTTGLLLATATSPSLNLISRSLTFALPAYCHQRSTRPPKPRIRLPEALSRLFAA